LCNNLVKDGDGKMQCLLSILLLLPQLEDPLHTGVSILALYVFQARITRPAAVISLEVVFVDPLVLLHQHGLI